MLQRLVTGIKVVVGPLVLIGLLRLVGVEALVQTFQQAHRPFLLLALLAYLGTVALRAYRWQIFLQAQGLAVPFPRLLYLDLVGSCFNLILPTGVGGDVVKFYELARERPALPDAKARIASSLLADRIAGLFVLLLMGAVVVPVAHASLAPGTSLLLVALALGSSVGLALLLHPALRRWATAHVPGLSWLLARPGLRGLYASLDGYQKPVLARAALAALLFNSLQIGVNVALGLAFGLALPLSLYLVVVPLISLMLALPLSINGLGVRESGYLFFLGQAGVAPPLALAVGLGYYACTVTAGLLGGLLYCLASLRLAKPPVPARPLPSSESLS